MPPQTCYNPFLHPFRHTTLPSSQQNTIPQTSHLKLPPRASTPPLASILHPPSDISGPILDPRARVAERIPQRFPRRPRGCSDGVTNTAGRGARDAPKRARHAADGVSERRGDEFGAPRDARVGVGHCSRLFVVVVGSQAFFLFILRERPGGIGLNLCVIFGW